VILAWRAPCGRCRFCQSGKPNFCSASLNAEKRMRTHDGLLLNQVLGIGTFCTHTLVHADQAIPYDPNLPAAQMSLIGCGVMTGVGAALYAAGVRPGTSVAVFGCGGVGDSVIQGARLGGATTIIAVDIDPKKLEWAKQFGATHTVNAREVEPIAKIKELTGGNGVNFSFEAVGKPQTLEQALFCRDLAGTCVLIGVPGPGPTLTLDLQRFFDLGGHLCVSWYGDCLPTRDFPLLAEWYRQGQLKLDQVVSRTVSLDEVEDAFAAMERGETLRSVIVF
jgi:S-(hydroxymethyl)mycothiol dehydrogenase